MGMYPGAVSKVVLYRAMTIHRDAKGRNISFPACMMQRYVIRNV